MQHVHRCKGKQHIQHIRKLHKEEQKIKEMSQKLQSQKVPSMFATGLCFASIVSTVSSLFEGQSIAKLPFEPVFFIKSIAHRGLTLASPNDCSFIFLYILSTMAFQPQQDPRQTYGS